MNDQLAFARGASLRESFRLSSVGFCTGSYPVDRVNPGKKINVLPTLNNIETKSRSPVNSIKG